MMRNTDVMTEPERPSVDVSNLDERVFSALEAYHKGYPLRNNMPAYTWRNEPTAEDVGLGDDLELKERCLRDGWTLIIDRYHFHAADRALCTPWART